MSETSDSSPIPLTNNIDKISEALAKAQGKFKQPDLNRTAKVYKDFKLLYETHYADLNQCIECIRGPLSENQLSFTQTITERRDLWLLLLTLRHSSGQIIESFLPINATAPSQQIGSQLTYFKRYQLSAFFGLAADYDDDANGDAGNNAELTSKKKNSNAGNNQSQNKNQDRGGQSKPPQQQSQRPPDNTQRQGNAGAASPGNSATKEETKDPADYVMPIGSDQVKGKAIGMLDEKTLRGILAWTEAEAQKTPPTQSPTLLLEISGNVKAFMKSMGEQV